MLWSQPLNPKKMHKVCGEVRESRMYTHEAVDINNLTYCTPKAIFGADLVRSFQIQDS